MAVLLGCFYFVNAQTGVNPDKVIKMTKETYDVGKIKHNEPVTFFMEFTNISAKPIIVENVMVGCGCTVAEKPSAPIAAGKNGKIKVSYNGAGAAGNPFTKDVTIKIKNADPKVVLFKGEII